MSAQSPSAIPTIVPFWNRLPKVMLYPANGAAMATIVLLGLANLLAMIGPIGVILLILPAMAMYRYAFECLQATADGFMEPPQVMQSSDRSLARKFIFLIIILAVLTVLGILLLGKVLGIALAVFLVISLPGATMTLAIEQSLSQALDPLKWVAIIAAIGWPYLAVVGLCLAISGSEGFAQNLVKNILPVPVALVGIGIISNYATVMTFHLMGYLLYQYHEELGLTPTAPQTDRPIASSDPDQQLLDEASELVRNGKVEEATERLRGRLRAGASPGVHAQYRKLLRVADNKPALLAHGQEFITVLIDQENDRAAVDLLRECQAIDPSFAPDTAGYIARLAHMAARAGQPQAAVQLLQGFYERFPKSQYVPQCYLLAAELLHENLGKDEQACELLRLIKTNFPSDPLMSQIDARLQAIERMIAATATKPKGLQS